MTKVSLLNDNVSVIGNLGDSVAHLLEVDLQDNLLYKWSEVSVVLPFASLSLIVLDWFIGQSITSSQCVTSSRKQNGAYIC